MKRISYPIIVLMLLVNMSVHISCGESPNRHIDGVTFKNSNAVRLKNMLENRDYNHAKQLTDSILLYYPDDPQSYLVLGWMADMQGDRIAAMGNYRKSVQIYDSLITIRKSLSDEINRAFVIQLMCDTNAYHTTLDSIKKITEYSGDSLSIDAYKLIIIKNKGDLFNCNHKMVEMNI